MRVKNEPAPDSNVATIRYAPNFVSLDRGDHRFCARGTGNSLESALDQCDAAQQSITRGVRPGTRSRVAFGSQAGEVARATALALFERFSPTPVEAARVEKEVSARVADGRFGG